MALMSLQSRSHVKASMVLTRVDQLFIHNYIRSLQYYKYYLKTYFIGPDRVLIHLYLILHVNIPSHRFP